MPKRDYYEVLGVSREAGQDEIRRAYRQAALKNHPDHNPGDQAAEDRFKEATEAYSVLSDADKRSAYDRFGHAGVEGRGFDFSGAGFGDIFSQFQDVFADFFGGFGGFGQQQQRRRGPERGRDVRIDSTITLEESITGCKKEVRVDGVAACEECSGTGREPNSKVERCADCGGSGQRTTQRGFIMFSTTCQRCRGTGEVILAPCKACRGGGLVEKTRTVLVTFPKGIDSGQRLRVPGQGMPGPPNGQAGDLYVDVDVAPHERFERQGYDLITRERVTFTDAALGAEVTLELPDGTSASTTVPAGTQPGTVLTIGARGVPHIDGRGRGDLHVLVDVDVPRKLSRRAKKLLKELEAELADSNTSERARAV